MDLIKMAREMGKEIQKSEQYQNLNAAKTANDNDQELQDLIGEFNLKRMQVGTEMAKEDKDQQKMEALNEELKAVYQKVMANRNMAAYNEAKKAMEQLMNQINMILTLCVNGEDPDTCDITSCGGSCATCGGCH